MKSAKKVKQTIAGIGFIASVLTILAYFNLSPPPSSPDTQKKIVLKNQVKNSIRQNINSLKESANNGRIDSQRKLAYLHYQGHPLVPQSYAQAALWFEKAANSGDPISTYQLASLYATGEGVEKNLSKSFALYEKVAHLGNIKAMNNIGMLYLEGKGVGRNTKKGMGWIEKSAEDGYIKAQINLSKIYKTGAYDTSVDLSKYKYWKDKAISNGYLNNMEKL